MLFAVCLHPVASFSFDTSQYGSSLSGYDQYNTSGWTKQSKSGYSDEYTQSPNSVFNKVDTENGRNLDILSGNGSNCSEEITQEKRGNGQL